jgi:hypothetical protein
VGTGNIVEPGERWRMADGMARHRPSAIPPRLSYLPASPPATPCKSATHMRRHPCSPSVLARTHTLTTRLDLTSPRAGRQVRPSRPARAAAGRRHHAS